MSDKPTDTPRTDAVARLKELFDWQDRLEEERIEQLRKYTDAMLSDAQEVDILRRELAEAKALQKLAEDHIAAADATIAELRRDKERLDWLNKTLWACCEIRGNEARGFKIRHWKHVGGQKYQWMTVGEGKTLREAIDAVPTASQQKGGGHE